MAVRARKYFEDVRPIKTLDAGARVPKSESIPEAKPKPGPRKAVLRGKSPRWLTAVISAGLLIAIVFIGGGLLLWQPWSESNAPAFISSYRRSLNFPLYYPTTLPDGFNKVVKNYSITDGVLLFNLEYDGKQLAVSEQPKPANIDYDTIVGMPRTATKITTRIGEATYSDNGSQSVAYILTDKTWLIINAPKGLDEPRLKTLLNAFQPVK